MSNKLDPDQDRHSVCPDLGPNSLKKSYEQRTKVAASTERVKRQYKYTIQPYKLTVHMTLSKYFALS